MGGYRTGRGARKSSINETYDLLGEGGVSIVGEILVSVDHALLAIPGTRLDQIRQVSSHPQALAQCHDFLATLDVEIVAVYDTAGAAKRIAEERRTGEAAVAAPRAAEMYGLEVLATGIQTYPDNQTRFVAISADPIPLGPQDKTSILFGVRNEPGALHRALGHLAFRNLNLSKLESRPLGREPWQYRFYADIDAGLGAAPFAEALESLKADVTFLQVLGSYHRWRPGGSGSSGVR